MALSKPPTPATLATLLVCPVCRDPFTTTARLPKMLACGHTVCLGCLRSLLEADVVMCPLDPEELQRPQAGDGESYPNNHLVTTLLQPEAHSVCAGCPQLTQCQPCKYCGRGFCTECWPTHMNDTRLEVERGLSDIHRSMGDVVILQKQTDTWVALVEKQREKTAGQINRYMHTIIEQVEERRRTLLQDANSNLDRSINHIYELRDDLEVGLVTAAVFLAEEVPDLCEVIKDEDLGEVSYRAQELSVGLERARDRASGGVGAVGVWAFKEGGGNGLRDVGSLEPVFLGEVIMDEAKQ